MSVSANKLGRYELRREIARSNDVVYEAWDPTVNRRVAIKELVMPPGVTGAAAKDRIQRFYREARAAGGLAHPNIVTIYEVGEDTGRHFIAMEYLEGPTLREMLQGGQTIPVDQAVFIAAQIADALAYAHGHGVIHRDVKPDNVHLMGGNLPKLTDFGIARIESETNITLAGQVFGTPSYMSPEQVAGGEISARTDIFSLAVMLFEMVSGRKPFMGESVVTITYNIIHETPVMPPNVPEWLAGVLRKALHKRPEDRYSGAAEMAEDLRRRRAPQGSPVAMQGFGSQSGAASPTVFGPGGMATTGPVGTTAGTVYYPSQRVRSYPRLRLPSLSEEARSFVVALLLTLFAATLLWWGIWASGKLFQKQRQAEAVQATAAERQQAIQAYKQGRYADAIGRFRALYRQSRKDSDRWMWARSHIEYGWQVGGAAAVEHFQAAVRIAPDAVQPLISLATYYYDARQPYPALQYADDALALVEQGAPDAPDMRGALAQLYLYLGDYASQIGPVGGLSATELWQRSVRADPALQSEAAAVASLRLRTGR